MKRIIVCVLLLALTVSLLAGCGKGFISAEEAQKVALKDLGIKENQAEGIHVHGGEREEGLVYSIHIDYQGQTYEYVILADNGEILSTDIVEGH